MNDIENLLDYYTIREKNKFCKECSMGNVKLEALLHIGIDNMSVSFSIGRQDVMQDLRNILKFIDAVRFQQMAVYGHNLAFVHSQGIFERDSLPIVMLLLEIEADWRSGRYGDIYCNDNSSLLLLNSSSLDKFINLYVGKQIRVERDDQIYDVSVMDYYPKLRFIINPAETGAGFNIGTENYLWLEGINTGYLLDYSSLYICNQEFYTDMKDFLRIIGRQSNDNSGFVPLEYYSLFTEMLLPTLEKYAIVESDIDFEACHPEEPKFALYLDYQKKGSRAVDSIVTGKINAIYESGTVNPIKNMTNDELYRNIRDEFQMKTLVESYLPKVTSDKEMYYLEYDDEKLLMLIEDGINRLREKADVYVTDEFKKIKVISRQKVSTGVRIESGLLEVEWDVEGMPADEVNAILESYRLKRTYHRLRNGDFLKLDDDGLRVLSKLKDNLRIADSQINEGRIELPLYRAMYVDSIMQSNSDRITIRKNDSFLNMTEQASSFENSDYEIPDCINASLREYQQTGYKWMRTLSNLGFGGILADDMGLGKTLQVLTFLQSQKVGTSLVVCPASLVYNWENECRKFVPDMKVMTLAGNAEERKLLLEDYKNYDIIITSYDLLKRDIELFEGIYFEYEICDEAQYIKNASTQAAKTVKSINSGIRFALTGTPIENRLSELWSIFDYLMPGYLFSYRYFKERFEVGIVQMEDSEALEELHNMIKPFILRRLKKDVLKDLPDKLEEVIYSAMDGEQENLYRAYEKQLVDSLSLKTDKEISSGKIEILAQLTKLRQICCDPSLLLDNYKGGSAKLTMCIELVTNAVVAGHKLLVFSQFAKMLEKLERKLNKEGVRTYKLTGETSKSDRIKMVDSFQNGEADVFLISLKAGGTGLNLTAADLVIHYDPWWNIAAQNQASDRVHRIGQNNKVSVFKLISRGTIEERILKLQDMKQELADQIISEGGVSVSGLTKNELLDLFS